MIQVASSKPLGFHLWMHNPATPKEGLRAQPYLSRLNLHFPSLGGEPGHAWAALWEALGVPSPTEGEMGGGRDLLWYYLKAKGLSEEGCEACGKFNFYRSCEYFQCGLRCHHSWSK